MTFRLDCQKRDGLWQIISEESPIPVSVVGQHAQLDEIRDALLAKIDEVGGKVVEGYFIIDEDIQSLKPLLDKMIADGTEHTGVLGVLIEQRASIAIQTSIAENAMWRKMLIGALSVQTALLIITLVILRLI